MTFPKIFTLQNNAFFIVVLDEVFSLFISSNCITFLLPCSCGSNSKDITKINAKLFIMVDQNILTFTYLKAQNKSKYDISIDDNAFFYMLLLHTLLLNKKYPML